MVGTGGGHVGLRTAEITETSGTIRSLSQGLSLVWRTKPSELMSMINGQTRSHVDCLNIKYILDLKMILSAASLLLPRLDTCSLVLSNCNDLVHIDENTHFVYLPGVIIDVFVPLQS